LPWWLDLPTIPSVASACLITLGTYGSRLHGDPRGTVDRHNAARDVPLLPRDDLRRNFERRLMKATAFRIDPATRRVLESAFVEVCEHRGWGLLAINVRVEHVHMVVAGAAPFDEVMTALKAYGTRALRRERLIDGGTRVWARHGSARPLQDEEAIAAAIDYTANRQGPDLPGAGPAHELGKNPEPRP
jgi:REP element-mobilizing transposase RayT